MANEIEFGLTLKYVNGLLKYGPRAWTLKFDQTTKGIKAFTWQLGTSEENLDVTDLTAMRYVLLLNTTATNYADIGMSDSGTMKALMRLNGHATYPDWCVFPLKPSTTIRGQGNTVTQVIEVIGFET